MRNKKKKYAVLFLMVTLCFVCLSYVFFCSKQFERPEKAVEWAIEAYQRQDYLALMSCYGKSIADLKNDPEISFQKKFFLSVGAQDVEMKETENILTLGDYIYIGALFDFIVNDGEPLPYYEYFIIRKIEDRSYKIVTPKNCPRTFLDYIVSNRETSKETKLYKEFIKDEKKYALRNPRYTENIYMEYNVLLNGIPKEMKKNLQLLGWVFLVAIFQMGSLYGCFYLVWKKQTNRIPSKRRRTKRRRTKRRRTKRKQRN